MSITPIGYIVLLVGGLLFFQRRMLFYAFLGSFPFSFVVMIDTPMTGIKPYQYLGFLLLLRELLDGRLRFPRFTTRVGISSPTTCLLLFLAAVYLSLLMPFLLADQIQVVNLETPFPEYANTEPLQFSSKFITQPFFITSMIIFYFVLAKEIDSVATIKRVISINVVCGVIALGSGLIYQIGQVFHRHTMISNLTWLVTGSGDTTVMEENTLSYNAFNQLPRMYSLVGEAGHTGLYLGLAAALTVATIFRPFKRITGFRSRYALSLMLVVGVILSGSTTGFLCLGLLIISLLLLPTLRAGRVGVARGLLSFVASMGFMAVFFVAVVMIASHLTGERMINYLIQEHLAKVLFLEGSGATRLETVSYSIYEVFLRSPLLGVGYGGHRSLSLLASLLSNVGIIGTVPFLLFNWVLIKRMIFVMRDTENPELVNLAGILLTAYLTCVPTFFVVAGIGSLTLGWYWCLMAMMAHLYRTSVVAPRLIKQSSGSESILLPNPNLCTP